MFPIAQGSYICNLGQIGQNVTKLSIKALGKMMMMNKIRIGNINACGLKGWPIDARQAPYAWERAKLARMERYQKCAFFWGGSGWPWLQAWGGWGAHLVAQGWPLAWVWSPMMLVSRGGRCVCVCVYEELYPSSFHESFEEIHSQKIKISIFNSKKPLFILRGWVLFI